MSDDTSAHEAALAQLELLRMGFTEKDFEGICMLPDCGCNGEAHE